MAVYTDVSFEELEEFLRAYDVGAPLSFKGIAEGVENSNFLLQTERGAFILTLYEKRVREKDLPFFLGLLEHLSSRGIACPVPVRTVEGKAWTHLNGRASALLTFLNGLSLRRPDVEHCAAAGAALAALHEAGSDFGQRRANALGVASWRKAANAISDKVDSIHPGMNALLAEALLQIEPSWPVGLPSGIIHADLFPDNVLFKAGRISGLIDFYFACHDALAYDLAVALNAWCFESDGFNITKGRALISAYQSGRKLSSTERVALPALAAGAALRFLLTRLHDFIHHDPMAVVRPKDPREFAKRLRFHLRTRSAEEYGY
ncbi:MAG: homoserine kinase [Alphaproteobacteria bacterium]|nr:homoserine kinase [Alphaproteobacteria bacterium]